MKNCPDVQKNISAYTDNEVNLSLKKIIEGHLKDCHSCGKMFEDFQKIDSMLKRSPADLPSPDFAGEVMKKIRISVSDQKSFGKFKSVVKLFEEFLELFESNTDYHKSLDEFSDYPPFSMSHIYFNLYLMK